MRSFSPSDFRTVEAGSPQSPTGRVSDSEATSTRRPGGCLGVSWFARSGEGVAAISGQGSDRVVIVDDDPFVLKALTRVLRSSGFTPICFQAPADALTRLRAEDPAVIICDYVLPGMDGLVFLRRARALVPGAARILCTAADGNKIAGDALESGDIFCIMPKPWDWEELIATLKRAAELSRVRREKERPMADLQRQGAQPSFTIGSPVPGLDRGRPVAVTIGPDASLNVGSPARERGSN